MRTRGITCSTVDGCPAHEREHTRIAFADYVCVIRLWIPCFTLQTSNAFHTVLFTSPKSYVLLLETHLKRHTVSAKFVILTAVMGCWTEAADDRLSAAPTTVKVNYTLHSQ